MSEARKTYEREIFARIFQLSNKLQIFLDKQLSNDGLTAKQFFLMIVVNSFENHHPTFTEISERLGSSRQNAKQLALKLEKNGYLLIVKDELDARNRRVSLTKKAQEYWVKRDINDLTSMTTLFSSLSTKQLNVIYQGMIKIFEGVNKLEEQKE